METYAIHKGAMIAPRKARMTLDLIRGKKVTVARSILLTTNTKGSRLISKVLESAVANAVNNYNMNEENLYVETCYVDESLVMKRAKMDSRGHVGRKDHKTSHITIIVSELNK